MLCSGSSSLPFIIEIFLVYEISFVLPPPLRQYSSLKFPSFYPSPLPQLRNLGFSAIPLHGQMSQPNRLGALNKFKVGQANLDGCLNDLDPCAIPYFEDFEPFLISFGFKSV